jgi:hypothetical protein
MRGNARRPDAADGWRRLLALRLPLFAGRFLEELSYARPHGSDANASRERVIMREELFDMSKSEGPSPKAKEWQRRHDAACAIVARKYCDMFKFWRDCKYKPCRSARRCRGDQGACLEKRCWSVPREVKLAAHKQMIADTPAHGDRFACMAHYYAPTSLCLHDPKNQKTRTKALDKTQANAQAKARS